MATPIEDITFLARTARGIKGVPGGDITLPASTTAEGLDKAGNITINAHDAGATSVEAGNSGGGSFAFHVLGALNTDGAITVNGKATLKGSTTAIGLTVRYNAVGGQGFTFDGAPTAARTLTLPDFDGNVVVTSTTNVNSGRIMVSGNVHLQDNGSTQAIQLTGAPTGNRTQTFPDYNGDILSRNSASGVIDLNAYAIATFQLTRNGANCTFAFENAGADKANITSTGAMAQWGATPAASQPGAIADLTVTPVIAGADTVDALTLLMALNTLQSDMNSILAALRSAGVIAT